MSNYITNVTRASNFNEDTYYQNLASSQLARLSALTSDNNFNLNDFNLKLEWFNNNVSIYSSLNGNKKALNLNGTKDYLQWWHNTWGTPDLFFSNFSAAGNSGDHTINGKFVGDNYFGDITFRRKSLYLTQDEANGWNNDKYRLVPIDPNSTDTRKLYKLDLKTDNTNEGSGTAATQDDSLSADQNNESDLASTEGSDEIPSLTTYNTGNENKFTYTPLTFNLPPLKLNKHGWSDYLPLTAMRLNDKLNNLNQARLDKLKKFPLQEATYLLHKVTNGYFTRSQLLQMAANTRNIDPRKLTADADRNRLMLQLADEQASKYELQANQVKEQEYNLETEKALKIYNLNRENSVKVANNNRQQFAAAWNNILDANKAYYERENQSKNLYINDMYTNYGEYLKTKRLNENARLRSEYESLRDDSIDLLSKQYESVMLDPTNWDLFSTIYPQLIAEDIGQLLNLPPNIDDLTPIQKRLIVYWLENNKDPRYAPLWEEYKLQLETKYYEAVNKIKKETAYKTGALDLYVDNLFGLDLTPKRSLLVSPIFLKKSGGNVNKLTKLSDYTKQFLRELESIRRANVLKTKIGLLYLDKLLERINRELLILLKQAFK